jgi:hypothetical protein
VARIDVGEREQRGTAPSARAYTAAVLVAGLLLFCWPFVRSPPLGLLGSYAHLLGSWAALVVATACLARLIGRRETNGDA